MRCKDEPWHRANKRSWSLLLGALALLAPSIANGDWLVTRDGAVVDVEGTWQIEGDLLTFYLPSGRYSSMRSADVDLEASRELTRERTERSQRMEIEEPAQRPTIFVVTDADVYHPTAIAVTPDEPSDSQAVAAAGDGPEPESRDAVQVVGWREEIDVSAADLEILGTVENGGSNPVTNISIEVRLVDLDGVVLATSSARLDRSFLVPGTSTEFTASFPGVWSYDRAEFEIRSRGFVSHPESAR